MSRRNTVGITIFDAVTPQAVTSSTDATPIVVTKASHGYSTDDLVMINGHTTNVAANGMYKITVLTSSTFSLQDYNTGADIAGTGGGAGGATGVVTLAPKIAYVADFRNVILSIQTSGSANFTAKVAGSLGLLPEDATSHGNTPNFSATQSKSNPYTFVQLINLDTAATVNGATGITTSGTDLQNTYEVNVNALEYLTVIPTAWTAGAITIKALLTDNE
tara:strand:- start:2248 stop:2904 length:657 start_codon:yes stop_codon:yes gene_type:complete